MNTFEGMLERWARNFKWSFFSSLEHLVLIIIGLIPRKYFFIEDTGALKKEHLGDILRTTVEIFSGFVLEQFLAK